MAPVSPKGLCSLVPTAGSSMPLQTRALSTSRVRIATQLVRSQARGSKTSNDLLLSRASRTGNLISIRAESTSSRHKSNDNDEKKPPALMRGKLLTTPSRLLKLVVPLTQPASPSITSSSISPADKKLEGADQADAEPLALLVHPQQPLSYLERLIQTELPEILDPATGKSVVPLVYFKALDAARELDTDNGIEPRKPGTKTDSTPEDLYEGYNGPEYADSAASCASHADKRMVRWSPSTEIGDFVRDAARSEEFTIQFVPPLAKRSSESSPSPPSGSSGSKSSKRDILHPSQNPAPTPAGWEIYVSVPSFNDRTHYLRQRLRTTCGHISRLADIKRECDDAAHTSAQRVALGGAGLLVGYWYVVYRLTFETELGWDTMEPVTYLVGLSALIGGYLWFLYHNREVSYRAALKLTINRRQNQLYEARGFDLSRWEGLIEEANAYRKEIKQIAAEYDVEWDETKEEGDRKVTDAMAKERRKKGSKEDEDEDDEGSNDKKKSDDDGKVESVSDDRGLKRAKASES